jgi:hypothetical protein
MVPGRRKESNPVDQASDAQTGTEARAVFSQAGTATGSRDAVQAHGTERARAAAEAQVEGGTCESIALPQEVAVSVAVERHTVAMTLVTFLVILAAALMYQGAASTGVLAEFVAAGVGCLSVAAVVFFVARARLRSEIEAQCRKDGMDEATARDVARREVGQALRRLDRGRG